MTTCSNNNKCGALLCFTCSEALKNAFQNAQNDVYYEGKCEDCERIKQVMYAECIDMIVCDGCFGEKYCSCLYCGEFKMKDTICECQAEEDIQVSVFVFRETIMLIDKQTNNVYSYEDHTLIGIYDPISDSIQIT